MKKSILLILMFLFVTATFGQEQEKKWWEEEETTYEKREKLPETPGSFLIKSSRNQAWAIALSLTGAGINYLYVPLSKDDPELKPDVFIAVGATFGIIAFICEISAISNLGKAGKMMNKQEGYTGLYLNSNQHGIGLAYKF